MKRIIYYLMALAMIFGFTSCGETKTTNELTTTENQSENTTIEVTTKDIVILDDTYFQYSQNSTQNIDVNLLDITDDVRVYSMDFEEIPVNDVLVKNERYEIKSSYVLENAVDGNLSFILIFDDMQTTVKIEVSDKTEPYIISSSMISTDGKSDIVFQFELFDGSFKQVTSDEMSNSDYHIDNNYLTIDADFISMRFSDEDSFVVNYVLEDESLVIGLIIISKD